MTSAPWNRSVRARHDALPGSYSRDGVRHSGAGLAGDFARRVQPTWRTGDMVHSRVPQGRCWPATSREPNVASQDAVVGRSAAAQAIHDDAAMQQLIRNDEDSLGSGGVFSAEASDLRPSHNATQPPELFPEIRGSDFVFCGREVTGKHRIPTPSRSHRGDAALCASSVEQLPQPPHMRHACTQTSPVERADGLNDCLHSSASRQPIEENSAPVTLRPAIDDAEPLEMEAGADLVGSPMTSQLALVQATCESLQWAQEFIPGKVTACPETVDRPAVEHILRHIAHRACKAIVTSQLSSSTARDIKYEEADDYSLRRRKADLEYQLSVTSSKVDRVREQLEANTLDTAFCTDASPLVDEEEIDRDQVQSAALPRQSLSDVHQYMNRFAVIEQSLSERLARLEEQENQLNLRKAAAGKRAWEHLRRGVPDARSALNNLP